jgi:hypothetical protein
MQNDRFRIVLPIGTGPRAATLRSSPHVVRAEVETQLVTALISGFFGPILLQPQSPQIASEIR